MKTMAVPSPGGSAVPTDAVGGHTLPESNAMQHTINGHTLELHQGDITDQRVDAIVNAANSRLAGGGGVDGAIHRRGGATIMAETDARYPDGCPTGSAVITGGGDLPARHVIHAVGPVWGGGGRGEAEQLASAYRRSLELAAEHALDSVAFPSLSTGAYRYPMDQAARVALETVVEFLGQNDHPRLVRFILFDEGAYGAYAAALEQVI
jgi:O-acetyl-ADP-ribose deacetylase (regulator of RNase III)